MEDLRGIERVALLREPARRDLYEYVHRNGGPVGREEAARAVGVSRATAAFHLDRLAEAGLLEVEYRRLSGRSGRGAGRPAKLYRPSVTRAEASVPPTSYALAGDLLVRAVRERRPDESADQALRRTAAAHGEELGAMLPRARRSRSPTSRMRAALEDLGYRPADRGATVILRNCPFHELAERHPEEVCAMNLAFLRGVAEGVDAGSLTVRPHQEPGTCCVAVDGP
ncbi:MAG TPA: helix-turn-helix domain-containing protein [Actinomycetota bacterium]|nr:helix-turn-helix domain-containing protein [Actinomycetota bacterium]